MSKGPRRPPRRSPGQRAAKDGPIRRVDPAPLEEVERDTDGTILRGPSLVCGCPLDSGCDGRHPGRLV